MPVTNYSPELLQLFELGSQKPFRFDCKTNKKAHAFRWRLHSLRREMRKENHWLAPVAEAVVISIEPDAKTGTIICAHPPDESILGELQQALKEQGAKVIAEAGLDPELELELEKTPESWIEPEPIEPILPPPQPPQPPPTKSFQHTKTPYSENAIQSFLNKKGG